MSIESIVRPIVEGKLRDLVQQHPSILEGVLWFKGTGQSKEDVFIGSAAKRIIGDLVSQETAERLRGVLCGSNRTERSAAAHHSAAGPGEGSNQSLPYISAGDVITMLDGAGLRVMKDHRKITDHNKTSERLLADHINDLIEGKVEKQRRQA